VGISAELLSPRKFRALAEFLKQQEATQITGFQLSLPAMAPSRTRTVKNKHAANGSGIKNSKTASRGGQSDGVSKSKKPQGKTQSSQINGLTSAKQLMKKKKRKVYTEKELGIPKLNMITPVGVEKPKGKKKGKVFVDDRVGRRPCNFDRYLPAL
jgi:hypothetical protein